jgi:hypothetical protein
MPTGPTTDSATWLLMEMRPAPPQWAARHARSAMSEERTALCRGIGFASGLVVRELFMGDEIGGKQMAGRRFLVFGLVAAVAAAGGTAWAVTQADTGPGLPAPPAGIVAQGTAPSGATYTISRIEAQQVGEDPSGAFCFEIATPGPRAQACAPVPDEAGLINGQPQRPSFAILGSDRFFVAVAPRGVDAMEVGVVGQGKAATSRSLDAGPAGRALLAIVGGRQTGSRDPSASRDYELRLLDANGRRVRAIAVSDPGE